MNMNVTIDDKLAVDKVRKAMLAAMAVPRAQLEHAVQVAHESGEDDFDIPPEVFIGQGVTRQALRMFWHFRCNLEAILPREVCR